MVEGNAVVGGEGEAERRWIEISEAEVYSNEEIIYDAIENKKTLRFEYNGSERLVDPYAFGLSSYGNPLLRGYQWAGDSLSGKGPGWRVFQVRKMKNVVLEGVYFQPLWGEFDPNVSWIWDLKAYVW